VFNQTVAAVQCFWYSLCNKNLLPLEDYEFTSCVFLTTPNDIMQLQKVVSLTLTFSLLATILQPSLCVAEQVYYVTPDSETTCPSTPCHISHYIQNPSVYFQSNHVFKFLPGVHILDARGIITYVSNIALTGDPTMVPSESEIPFQPSSEIWCTGQAGFVFMHVENLLIEKLSFTNCTFPYASDWSIALLITDVANLTISRIVVQNTTGYGMIGTALKGNTSIFESAFLCNHGDENRVGTVIILLDSCNSPGNNNTSVSLNIWSTYFLSGNFSTLDVSPTGLTVSFLDSNNLCTNTYIILDKVTFSHNKNGNLWLVLYYSDTTSVSVTIENSRIEGGMAMECGSSIWLVDSTQLQLQDCPNPQTSNQASVLRLFNTTVTRNTGIGLWIRVSSKCTKLNIEIDHVVINENNFTGSRYEAALKIQGVTTFEVCPRRRINPEKITVKMFNTVVTRNIGGGVIIAILNNCTTVKWNIEMNQVAFIDNINPSDPGGGLYVLFTGGTATTPTHYLRISNCVFQSGLSSTGGGASVVAAFIADHFDDAVNKTHEWMSLLHSHFIGNTGLYGGGLAITIMHLPSNNQPFLSNALVTYMVHVENTTFTDNTAWSGSAVFIALTKADSLVIRGPQQFILESTSFRHNHRDRNTSVLPEDSANIPGHESTVYFMNIQNVTISNCEFIQNNGTALTAEQSNIVFTGDVLFKENWGTFGGALSLFYSFQFLLPQTNLHFLSNHAERFGGAIYYLLPVEAHLVRSTTSCFMTMLFLPHNLTLEDSGVSVNFINNTALQAGDAMYGTPIDREVCTTVTVQYFEQEISPPLQSSDSTLNLSGQTGSSIVTSAAQRVCFCEYGRHNCTRNYRSLEAFPGQDFTISVVAVGQREGTVPSVIHAKIKGNTATMNEFQESQETSRYCTDITYT